MTRWRRSTAARYVLLAALAACALLANECFFNLKWGRTTDEPPVFRLDELERINPDKCPSWIAVAGAYALREEARGDFDDQGVPRRNSYCYIPLIRADHPAVAMLAATESLPEAERKPARKKALDEAMATCRVLWEVRSHSYENLPPPALPSLVLGEIPPELLEAFAESPPGISPQGGILLRGPYTPMKTMPAIVLGIALLAAGAAAGYAWWTIGFAPTPDSGALLALIVLVLALSVVVSSFARWNNVDL